MTARTVLLHDLEMLIFDLVSNEGMTPAEIEKEIEEILDRLC